MSWINTIRTTSVLVGFLTLPAFPAFAQITGSSHDFLGAAWNTTGENCVVCHVPHDGNSHLGDVGLLWNHELSMANYELYSGFDLENDPMQPQAASKICLGCHDGTIGLDSFGPNSGTVFIEEGGLLGTDLSATHPISIQFSHDDAPSSCSNCHAPHGGGPSLSGGPLPFFEGRLECPTCHDPHNAMPLNPGGVNMLRLDNSTSELCFHCHDK